MIGCSCPVCTSLDFRDKRLRTSVHIQTDFNSIVIDSGPDFRQQALRAKIQRLDALLITHEHKDHIAGMDDVRAYNFWQKTDMPVYGRSRVLDAIRREFPYAFADYKYPGIPQITLNEITSDAFELNGETILPIEVMHYKLPTHGFRLGDFTYITDANAIGQEALDRIKGSKVLVLNALQKEAHVSHFTLEQALDIVEQVQPQAAYFTHMSHRMGKHSDIEKELPHNVRLAYDGLTLRIE